MEARRPGGAQLLRGTSLEAGVLTTSQVRKQVKTGPQIVQRHRTGSQACGAPRPEPPRADAASTPAWASTPKPRSSLVSRSVSKIGSSLCLSKRPGQAAARPECPQRKVQLGPRAEASPCRPPVPSAPSTPRRGCGGPGGAAAGHRAPGPETHEGPCQATCPTDARIFSAEGRRKRGSGVPAPPAEPQRPWPREPREGLFIIGDRETKYRNDTTWTRTFTSQQHKVLGRDPRAAKRRPSRCPFKGYVPGKCPSERGRAFARGRDRNHSGALATCDFIFVPVFLTPL